MLPQQFIKYVILQYFPINFYIPMLPIIFIIRNNLMKEQQTQQSKSHQSFIELLKSVYDLIDLEEYAKCQDLLRPKEFEDVDREVEVMSLRGYVMSLCKKYTEALALFETCLRKKPYHLPSKKRKALMLEKLGDIDQCKKQFQSCLYLQPQSKSIRNKLRRLQSNSAKSYSVSSQDNKHQQKLTIQSHSIYLAQKQVQKPKSQSVKFGNFQIIQITQNEDSDEHFAIIKQQISKLADKKPKKSILKDSMSASIFKEKVKETEKEKVKQQFYFNGDKAKIENIEEKQGPIKNQNQMEQIKPLKKKAKSVTFKGDTNLQDFS